MGDGVTYEVFGNRLTRRELAARTGDVSAVAGIRSVVLDDGVQRGVRAIDLRTSSGLEIEVLVDRAMDLGSARLRGVPVGWRSGNGFRHPGLHEHSDEGCSAGRWTRRGTPTRPRRRCRTGCTAG
jgi:hypothetical protein